MLIVCRCPTTTRQPTSARSRTSRASAPTGGIGATINIKTARPLDTKKTIASICVKAVHDGFALSEASNTPVMLEVTMNLRSQQSAVGSVDQGVSAWFSCYGTTVFINIQERGNVERQQTGICPTSVGEARSIAGVFYARSGTEAFESSPATPAVSHGSYAAQAWYRLA